METTNGLIRNYPHQPTVMYGSLIWR